MNNSIENQQIKGLSIKTFYSIIVSTAMTVGSVLGVYYSLKGDISDIQLQRTADDRYRDLQLQTLETAIKSIQVQIDKVSSEVNEHARQLQLQGDAAYTQRKK